MLISICSYLLYEMNLLRLTPKSLHELSEEFMSRDVPINYDV